MTTKTTDRNPLDSAYYWAGLFIASVTAAYMGDLADVTEYTARFLVWVAGLA